jgi:hypothetical protein
MERKGKKRKIVTFTARIPIELRDKLEAYRKKHGLRSFNQAIIHLLENMDV